MSEQELIDILREGGMDEAQAKAVAANEKVKAKTAGLKQQSDYDSLAARAADLQSKYEGANGRPGAKSYEEWYRDNYAKILKYQEDLTKYNERYGALDGATGTVAAAAQTGGKQLTEEDIDKRVSAKVAESLVPYSDRWSGLLKGSGKIVERHIRAKRDREIDWDEVAKIAAEKTNGDIDRAYEEWDAPEREKAAKASTDAEITRRVNEELAKRSTQALFPSGADGDSSSTGSRGILSQPKQKEYDRSKVIESFLGVQ